MGFIMHIRACVVLSRNAREYWQMRISRGSRCGQWELLEKEQYPGDPPSSAPRWFCCPKTCVCEGVSDRVESSENFACEASISQAGPYDPSSDADIGADDNEDWSDSSDEEIETEDHEATRTQLGEEGEPVTPLIGDGTVR